MDGLQLKNEQGSGLVKTPFGRLASALSVGLLGYYIIAAIPTLLLNSLKVMEIAPKEVDSIIGLYTALLTILGLIMGPVSGAIGDRTKLKFGHRRIWILFGGIIASICYFGVAFSDSVTAFIAWSLAANFFLNFQFSSFMALIPEQVAPERQGTFSGIVGIFNPVAITVGMGIMTALNVLPLTNKWFVIAVINIVAAVLSVMLIKDGPALERKQHVGQKLSFAEKMSKVYPSPRKYPSFTWGVVTKAFASMGFYTAMIYNTLLLINKFHYTSDQVTGYATLLQGTQTLMLAVSSILGGMFSDKIKKQKPFVFSAAVFIGIGLLTMGFGTSFQIVLIGNMILGFGFGMYTAVDVALIARILPRKEDAAKDFGLMNAAGNLPNIITGIVGPMIIAVGGFKMFYGIFALTGIISALAVLPIPEISKKSHPELEVSSVE
jgi:MFS family permease